MDLGLKTIALQGEAVGPIPHLLFALIPHLLFALLIQKALRSVGVDTRPLGGIGMSSRGRQMTAANSRGTPNVELTSPFRRRERAHVAHKASTMTDTESSRARPG